MSLGSPTAGNLTRVPTRVDVGQWNASKIFAAALGLQLFHQLEHFVQVSQAKILGIKPAHGILGSLVDLEWVHFVYNNGLYVLLLAATVLLLRDERIRPPAGWLWLGATIAVQTYHVFEHVVKITQHVSTGADPAPGILGFVVDLVWLHFAFNMAVTIAMIGAFVYLGMYRELRPAGAGRLSVVSGRTLAIAGGVGSIAFIALALASSL